MKKIHNVLVAAALTAVILMTSCQPARQPAAVPSETAENHTESAETSAYGNTTCVPDSSLIADTQDVSQSATETETEPAAVTETETDEETTETDLVSQKNIEPDSTDPINTAPPDTEPKVTESEETQTPPADSGSSAVDHVHFWSPDPNKEDYTDEYHWLVCEFCNERKTAPHAYDQEIVVTAETGDVRTRRCPECEYIETKVFERDLSNSVSPGLVFSRWASPRTGFAESYYTVWGDPSSVCGEITIPAEYRGIPVKTIKDHGFMNCELLEKVIISDGVDVQIGAFSGCTGLKEVTVPDNWTEFPIYVFDGCYSLSKINVRPGQIKKLGNRALSCTAITDISDFYSAVIKEGNKVFDHCSGLTEITVQGNWEKDSTMLFSCCNNLRSITFADDCKALGWGWFEGCEGLTEIVLPETIEIIWDFCFSDCTNLKTVTIKNKNLSIKSRDTFGNDPIDTINYAGTVAEWNERNLSSYFDSEHYTVHCTDGDIVK
ncbi:MAG: leucine-rich repeat domain-containing protein [Clostridia bacterium]|nr:leucine-rich repeat domain-containing protein [Clostridia bacterium]MBR5767899.1 leucine-rich repeat domain-containing protein [Clostridia bacterium]